MIMAIYTVEEAIKQGIDIAGRGNKSQFIISSRGDKYSRANLFYTKDLKQIFNKNFSINDYFKNKIKHLAIVFIVLKKPNSGASWQERKYYNNEENELVIELKLSDYDRFCNATREEALKILAQETLRGIEKFLTKVTDFDFPKFYVDVKELFEKEFGN